MVSAKTHCQCHSFRMLHKYLTFGHSDCPHPWLILDHVAEIKVGQFCTPGSSSLSAIKSLQYKLFCVESGPITLGFAVLDADVLKCAVFRLASLKCRQPALPCLCLCDLFQPLAHCPTFVFLPSKPTKFLQR